MEKEGGIHRDSFSDLLIFCLIFTKQFLWNHCTDLDAFWCVGRWDQTLIWHQRASKSVQWFQRNWFVKIKQKSSTSERESLCIPPFFPFCTSFSPCWFLSRLWSDLVALWCVASCDQTPKGIQVDEGVLEKSSAKNLPNTDPEEAVILWFRWCSFECIAMVKTW